MAGTLGRRAFQFRPELGSARKQLRARRRLLPESMIDDVLLAILSLPVCVSDLRAKVSPLVLASTHSSASSLLAQMRLGSR